jgi:hypothetical protein
VFEAVSEEMCGVCGVRRENGRAKWEVGGYTKNRSFFFFFVKGAAGSFGASKPSFCWRDPIQRKVMRRLG